MAPDSPSLEGVTWWTYVQKVARGEANATIAGKIGPTRDDAVPVRVDLYRIRTRRARKAPPPHGYSTRCSNRAETSEGRGRGEAGTKSI